jgi:hypothetical protein
MKVSVDSMFRVHRSQLHVRDFEYIKEVLTLEYEGTDKTLELWEYDEETGVVSFPRAFFAEDLKNRSDVEMEDLTVLGHEMLRRGKTKFSPRGDQEFLIESMLKHLRIHNSGNLVSGCGTGKTVMGAEIAVRLGRSTCVLVHKEFLGRQWEDAFRLVHPKIRIGWMQRDRVDFGKDFDVVIAVTQSVVNAKRSYPLWFYSSFGFVIFDEIHRYAAELWQRCRVVAYCSEKVSCKISARSYRDIPSWGWNDGCYSETYRRCCG